MTCVNSLHAQHIALQTPNGSRPTCCRFCYVLLCTDHVHDRHHADVFGWCADCQQPASTITSRMIPTTPKGTYHTSPPACGDQIIVNFPVERQSDRTTHNNAADDIGHGFGCNHAQQLKPLMPSNSIRRAPSVETLMRRLSLTLSGLFFPNYMNCFDFMAKHQQLPVYTYRSCCRATSVR